MVGNGLYFRDLRKVMFWEQSSALVSGPRIWDPARCAGQKVGMMFWQQSLGENVDLVVSPAPIHKHGGGMIQDCYTAPAELQQRLRDRVGRSFNLMNYWGPLASKRSTRWIVDATNEVMRTEQPEVLLTYLPHLDYDLQRHGPDSVEASRAKVEIAAFLEQLKASATENGYESVFFGDYSIEQVTYGAVFPNRALAREGLLSTREVRGMLYPDFHTARAFAITDHAVAHIHTDSAATLQTARELFAQLPAVDLVLDRSAQKDIGLEHANSGDLLLVAAPGAWFAYPWWTEKSRAPDFASHVDIHNKPGYDPCELFFGWPPLSVSRDETRVKGTHGRSCPVAWDSSIDLGAPRDHVALGTAIGAWLDRESAS